MVREPTRLLSYAEAADLLGLHVSTVRGLVSRGDLPIVRIGNAVRFDTADLKEFIESRKSREKKH